MALKSIRMYNLDMAQKLLRRATVLSPYHRGVFLHCRKFSKHDRKALAVKFYQMEDIGPINLFYEIQDGLGVDELSRIHSKKSTFLSLNKEDPSFKRLEKEFYFRYIHHTVAIGGNTMSLAETKNLLETRMVVPGKSISEHNEILGQESALRYINETLANKDDLIAADDILEIQKRVVEQVDPSTAGRLKKIIDPRVHFNPDPDEEAYLSVFPSKVPHDRFADFVMHLHELTVSKAHPIRIAARLHHQLVYEHFFIDGNLRTARLLMNFFLTKCGFPPITIFKEEADYYFECAHNCSIRPFHRFIAKVTERSLDAFLQHPDIKIKTD